MNIVLSQSRTRIFFSYRNAWTALIAVMLIGSALIFLECCSFSACDGSYDLEVSIKSASKTPIETVRCEPLNRSFFEDITPTEIEVHLAEPRFLPVLGLSWRTTVRPFEGQGFAVPIYSAGRVSLLLSRSLGYSQEKYLLLSVDYSTGKRAGKVVEIPDQQESRKIAVEVP